MVNVRSDNQQHARMLADVQIPNLISYWKELPEVHAEIDSWGDDEALTYIEEWPLYEMFRRQLEEASRNRWLTPEQEREMDKLRVLVQQHGDKLRELLR